MSVEAQLRAELDALRKRGQYRTLPGVQSNAGQVNLSTNDYLALGQDVALQQAFLAEVDVHQAPLGACSSRLLTGNFAPFGALETALCQAYGRQALVFNSGYHANIGILPALANKHTLILADKLIHASVIDGIRLSACDFKRFRHNDMAHLAALLATHHANYARVIIATESVFSMDGDSADLGALVALKKRYENVLLYVDEAHSVGCYGAQGLGWAQKCGVIDEIDLLVGTFGKAFASTGAFVICAPVMAAYLTNTMRPLIFSTALSPLVMAWSGYVLAKMPKLAEKRAHLAHISARLREGISTLTGQANPSTSYIVPLIVGENDRAVALAQALQQRGFYCLPIRPPTVPQGTARIRFSLHANVDASTIDALLDTLETLLRA